MQTFNYLVFWYDGNQNFITMIHGATPQQMQEFIDNGGNDDFPMQEIMLVMLLGNTPYNELAAAYDVNSTGSLDWVKDLSIRNEAISHFTVSYVDYPEGKIVPMPKDPTTISPEELVDIGGSTGGDDPEDLEFGDDDNEDFLSEDDDENE